MTTNRTDLKRIVQEGFLTSGQANKLKAAGIEDGPHLVKAWGNPAERVRLAQAAGLPVNRLMQTVFVANLLQLSAPGEAAIDMLLQHKDEIIPEFEDTEEDHEIVCLGRQGIIQNIGQLIYENERLRAKHSLRPHIIFFIRTFGFGILGLLGLIVYTQWSAVIGNFGPDLTSQLAQALFRRQALVWSGSILLLLGIACVVSILSTIWLMGSVNLWLSERFFDRIGRTPRDAAVRMETQNRIPPAWAKIDQLMDRVGLFIWSVPILVGCCLPGVQGWASLILFGLLFSWIFLKVLVIRIAFNETSPAWAQQARARQAGLMLSKIIAMILVIFALYVVWFFTAWLASLSIQAWTQFQAQEVTSEAQAFLAQQTLEPSNLADLNQFVLETTRSWAKFGQGMLDLYIRLLPVVSQMVSVGLFAFACGAAFGWHIFVRRSGWFKAFLLLSGGYLISTIVPELAAWWFFEAPQNLIGPPPNIPDLLLSLRQTIEGIIPGMTIGLFLALGQNVFEGSQDGHLKYECPECHILISKPVCECGRKRGFEEVLDL